MIGFLLVYWPSLLWADPLDRGEAYTTRQGPPEWMDKTDFALLLVNYGIFALALIGLAWLLFKRPEHLHRLEVVVLCPFKFIFSLAKRTGGWMEVVLQILGGLAAFLTMATWVFFCQWLKHEGLGALSMVGLAFAALMLVRLLKGDDKPQAV
ncbi:MAG: hypothetical protein COB41_05660 [Proteobacteria bacterium]|nr:MAG: hypothetical protein COB41_05660 [Pseudomonadota bacterium]